MSLYLRKCIQETYDDNVFSSRETQLSSFLLFKLNVS